MMEGPEVSLDRRMTLPEIPDPRRPSDMVQAAASVALAVYLLGLVLAIAGNSVSGSSALMRTIKSRLFSPWMQPAWLDLGFDHPLTYGLPEDADHTIEVRSRGGSRDAVTFPGNRTGEQASRWRRFARAIALAADADAAPPLTAGVGAGSFADMGSEDVTVRVLRRPLPERTAPPADARPRQPHAARVRRVAGEIQVIEMGGPSKQAELAPVLRKPERASSPKPTEESGDE
jgi:hypothetical protein